MYQNLVSWACPKFIFTPKRYQFNNNNINLALQISIGNKNNFKHFLLKDFLKPIHKFKPLTGTTSIPVTFIGEYPLPPRMYIGPFKVFPSIYFKGRLSAMLLILKNVSLFPCKQNFYKKGFALSLVLK